ncbi:hypothetical protein [Phyllobacterium calauticae]|jgi:hypothetical protein|uniref:hypothetical protein n=1 Tax=Phyllobacterium calauticae TaxID=2817027 RepID=UPI001CBAEA2B|nr:hypothetical protein [Phyllobacterium calauticae]MBZ3693230.1 hypothetical protein [Phyllobacterium calauticae]
MSTELMTRSDRETLIKIARQRERLAKTEAKSRGAQLTADFEKQLDQRYHYDQNDVWSEAFRVTKDAMEKAKKAIQEECERLGIPAQFAPSISLGWSDRGRNALKEERVEMRRVAMKQIAAIEQNARSSIERQSVSTQEQIMVGGLTSDQAKLFLDEMPTAETLMPALTLDGVEALLIEEKKS